MNIRINPTSTVMTAANGRMGT